MSDAESDESESVSPEDSDHSSSETELDDASDVASLRSLAFSVKADTGRATIKSKKSKKRVRFKPGDSLVLVYVIPNREMLGLKSESEDSDESGESDDDSDDECDEDDDEDDDDDDDDDEEDDSDEENNESKAKSKKSNVKKEKPFAKLIAVKQVNRRKVPDLRNNVKKARDNSRKVLNFDLSAPPPRLKKRNSKQNKKEKKELRKEVLQPSAVQLKQSKTKKNNKCSAIKADVGKANRPRRNRTRLLEIRATVQSSSKSDVQTSVPKGDIKPAIIDVNSSISASSKPLTNRTRLQPTSFHISKPISRPNSGGTSKSVTSLPEKKTSVAQVVSASYESLSSVLPDSYVTVQSFENGTAEEETIKRLDPDLMNTKSKRNYAWQIANGTISSQSLRTPSILPFWDSLQNSMTEKSTLKLPT